MQVSPITELDVQALVDSQLNWEEQKRVSQGIRRSLALTAYYTRIVAQKKLLLLWWQNEPGNGRPS